MVDVNIISGFLRIVDYDLDIVYCIFDLTKFEQNRIYRAFNLIKKNIERVIMITYPSNKTIQLCQD